MRSGFLGAQCGHDTEVRGFVTLGNGRDRNEKDSISAFNGAEALGEASDFIAIGTLPNVAFTAFAELTIHRNFSHVGVDRVPVKSGVASFLDILVGKW